MESWNYWRNDLVWHSHDCPFNIWPIMWAITTSKISSNTLSNWRRERTSHSADMKWCKFIVHTVLFLLIDEITHKSTKHCDILHSEPVSQRTQNYIIGLRSSRLKIHWCLFSKEITHFLTYCSLFISFETSKRFQMIIFFQFPFNSLIPLNSSIAKKSFYFYLHCDFTHINRNWREFEFTFQLTKYFISA